MHGPGLHALCDTAADVTRSSKLLAQSRMLWEDGKCSDYKRPAYASLCTSKRSSDHMLGGAHMLSTATTCKET